MDLFELSGWVEICDLCWRKQDESLLSLQKAVEVVVEVVMLNARRQGLHRK